MEFIIVYLGLIKPLLIGLPPVGHVALQAAPIAYQAYISEQRKGEQGEAQKLFRSFYQGFKSCSGIQES